ncbi:hypothetical protein C0991_008579 [Blastosporella zonata]|nr:hypothetical protein C0991_008579 [Blastosporella zonata]
MLYYFNKQVMGTYPLIIAQFNLQGHPGPSEHWSLVAMADKNNAFVFEISGNSSNFKFNPHHLPHFGRNQSLRGGCQVGTVQAESMEWMEDRLSELAIVYNDPNFDCQTWVLIAINTLRQADTTGVAITLTDEAKIREEMELEKQRWDDGDDTVEDRLF